MTNIDFKELPIPPEARNKKWATELVRVWAADGNQHISLSNDIWEDPANWGILLVDLAKHIANSYSNKEGEDVEVILSRIKEGFDVEWEFPTDQ